MFHLEAIINRDDAQHTRTATDRVAVTHASPTAAQIAKLKSKALRGCVFQSCDEEL